MDYYIGIGLKIVPFLIGAIFIVKLVLVSKDKKKVKELERKLTPSTKFNIGVFFFPALLLTATIAMAMGDYSDNLIEGSKLGQKQDKQEKPSLHDAEQKLSCSPIGGLSLFNKCEK